MFNLVFSLLKTGKNNYFGLLAIFFIVYYAISNYSDNQKVKQIIQLQHENQLLIRELQLQSEEGQRVRQQLVMLTTELKELNIQKLQLSTNYESKLESLAHEFKKNVCSVQPLSHDLIKWLQHSTATVNNTSTPSNK